MEQLNRLFGEYVKDLAPGTPNPSQVVKERILYRSAREKSQLPLKNFKGDNMDVDLNDFTMPLGEPKTAERKQIPKTRPTTKEKDIPGKKEQQTGEIDQIDSIKGLENIEQISGIESSRSKTGDRRAEERKKKDDAMDTGDRKPKKEEEDNELKIEEEKEKDEGLSTDDKEKKDSSSEDEDESDDFLMSLVGGL